MPDAEKMRETDITGGHRRPRDGLIVNAARAEPAQPISVVGCRHKYQWVSERVERWNWRQHKGRSQHAVRLARWRLILQRRVWVRERVCIKRVCILHEYAGRGGPGLAGARFLL
jgi:hypothetical protein